MGAAVWGQGRLGVTLGEGVRGCCWHSEPIKIGAWPSAPFTQGLQALRHKTSYGPRIQSELGIALQLDCWVWPVGNPAGQVVWPHPGLGLHIVPGVARKHAPDQASLETVAIANIWTLASPVDTSAWLQGCC